MSSATEDFFFFLSLPYHTKQGNSIIGLSILDNEGCQCRSWLPRFNYSGPKLLLSSSWCTLVPVHSFCSQMGRSGRLGSRWSNVDVVHLKVCPLAAITGVEYGLDIILGQEKLFFGSNWWNLSAPENSWGGTKAPTYKTWIEYHFFGQLINREELFKIERSLSNSLFFKEESYQ